MMLCHLLVTWALVGLIWTVQLVVYPAFRLIPSEVFGKYHARHMQHITWVVGPLILLEIGSAVLLWSLREDWRFLLSLVALGAVWLSTALYQVPLHTKLSLVGWDAATVDRLVRTNWIRTLGWSLRAGLLAWTAAAPH
jgi:hypothetical protein